MTVIVSVDMESEAAVGFDRTVTSAVARHAPIETVIADDPTEMALTLPFAAPIVATVEFPEDHTGEPLIATPSSSTSQAPMICSSPMTRSNSVGETVMPTGSGGDVGSPQEMVERIAVNIR
jgi:hypothetical protein